MTGSNRGIGLEYCRQLKARGEEVIATCRTSSSELDNLGIRVESGVEVSSEDSLLNLKNNLSGIKIDVLVNNAGIAEHNSIEKLDIESLGRQFLINAVSPLAVTHALLGNLKGGSKVIFMASRMGSIQDNKSGGYYGYRMSKAALCIMGKSLSIDLAPRGIAVALLHPGLVSTRMTGFTLQGITPTESVQGLLKRIDSLTMKTSGSFWHSNGEILPW